MKKINILSVVLVINACLLQAQNVGIGTSTPIVKLDVAGRLRLQHTGATAGIFFDGTSAPQRSFIGTIDNDHVGIFGAVTGWKFSFDVTNGNVGIGTINPTTALDVAGGFRLRDNSIIKGSMLSSNDALGNAKWLNPVSFKVLGYSAGASILFPHNTWTEINFGTNVSYNFGSGYNSGTSEFVAPQKGIYHFTSQLLFTTAMQFCAQRISYRRNGVKVIASITEYSGYNQAPFYGFTNVVDVELPLEAGDAVFIEGIAQDFGNNTGQRSINGSSMSTWFSGRLVQLL